MITADELAADLLDELKFGVQYGFIDNFNKTIDEIGEDLMTKITTRL